MTTINGNEALYLFYLTDSALAAQGPAAGEPDRVFEHRHAGLAAMLGIVPIDDFCGAEAERRMADLGWVGERAVRHERVIENGFQRGPVLPARFGTLFSSLHALERFVELNQRTIADFLGAVRGHEEWGIKALLERPAARRWLSARMAAPAVGDSALSPGLRYVQERRAQAAAEKGLQRWLLENCESMARLLDDYATERRQREIFDSAVPGDSRELVLNLAGLVPRERLKALCSHIESLNAERAGQGLSFTMSGPWPPYSFCPPLTAPP
jgi:gas vesicle protein GvpL/GvpF